MELRDRTRYTAKPPRHIVWDWNGTLQNDVQAAVNGINQLLTARGLPTVDVERHRKLFTFPVSHYYTALGFKLENENWSILAQTFITSFLSDKSTALFRGTVPTLTRLSEHGIDMSILSAAEQSTLEQTLVKQGIRKFFTLVSGLDNHGAGSKLHTSEILFKTIGGPLDQVWLVGDTTHDKEVADAAGCNCVLVASGYQSHERLEQCHCPVLNSVEDIPAFFGL